MMRVGLWTGLLKQWWEAEKAPPNSGSPCLSEASWNEALLKAGFSGIDVAFPDHEDPECHESSLLVATAVEAKSTTNVDSEFALIIDKRHSHQITLARAVQESLRESLRVDSYVLDLESCPNESLSQVRFALVLAEVDAICLNNMPQNIFEPILVPPTRSTR